jgi:nucleoside-diphosphate-sugar epimerase
VSYYSALIAEAEAGLQTGFYQPGVRSAVAIIRDLVAALKAAMQHPEGDV